ncbi:MAG: Dihydrolipoamide acetyltransferase component of pyruvate dehydrogenase complex [uncultured Friedmanniella sp.]|uniref:Dihydrolipoamide acetyltransferase component of pyruvate dehydrogenase complex n=1 Tax=uncultured Friedmanniella sp. TaxID=335381 RepID=A0A6J4LJC2_9ACTN|nr:MAG: Dihydrolipoamide acetyltransferase component of pyruvate dehydrogenase complex [uncultured Friedmanniella sp.]
MKESQDTMSTDVTLPALGESVTEGTVTRWLKQVGDTVAADEPLLEVSTDKVDTEIPSPAAGVLLEIRAQEDDSVEVGAVLAVIGEESEAGGGGDAPAEEPPSQEPAQAEASTEPEPANAADAEIAQDDPPAPTPERTAGSASGSGTEVTLPALGESVTEGTVSRWLKKVGDSVETDEPLLEVSTDKVDTEIPSPTAGTVLEIRVQEDETVEVGAVLAVVGDASASTGSDDGGAPAGEAEQPHGDDATMAGTQDEPQAPATATVTDGTDVEQQPDAGDEGGQAPIPAPEPRSAPAQPAAREDAQPEQHGPSSARTSPTPVAADGDAVYVTPLVRKLAKEHDVDLASVQGTGVGGRIRKQDVLAAAEEAEAAAEAAKAAPAPAPAAAATPSPAPASAGAAPSVEPSTLRGTTEKMSRLRKTIAKRMVESQQVSATLTATVEVDLTAISRIRAKAKDSFKAREGASLSYLPFIAKATVEALKVYPKLNATIDTEAGEVTFPASEHLGIAVDTEKGLLVPVIKDAGDLNIGGIAKKIADLASRTRQNKVTPDELSGGTFTITNYGSAGTLMDTPIINQPQVGILGTGALVKRPVVIRDANLGEVIAVRDMMYLSLSYDHRLVDGADAARFLSTLKQRLEEGDFGGEFGV